MTTEKFISCLKNGKGGIYEWDRSETGEVARGLSLRREKLGLNSASGIISDYGHALFLYAFLKDAELIDGNVWDFPLSEERVSFYLDCDLETARRAISILSDLGLIAEIGQFKDGDEHITVYMGGGRALPK